MITKSNGTHMNQTSCYMNFPKYPDQVQFGYLVIMHEKSDRIDSDSYISIRFYTFSEYNLKSFDRTSMLARIYIYSYPNDFIRIFHQFIHQYIPSRTIDNKYIYNNANIDLIISVLKELCLHEELMKSRMLYPNSSYYVE